MKKIEGQIIKIQSKLQQNYFYSFEFWGESDMITHGVLCLIQRSNLNKLFLVELNAEELCIRDITTMSETVIKRIAKLTGIGDLIRPEILRFDEQLCNNSSANFREYIKAYKPPVPVYKDIFCDGEESVNISELTVEEFSKLGGEIHLYGEMCI